MRDYQRGRINFSTYITKVGLFSAVGILERVGIQVSLFIRPIRKCKFEVELVVPGRFQTMIMDSRQHKVLNEKN